MRSIAIALISLLSDESRAFSSADAISCHRRRDERRRRAWAESAVIRVESRSLIWSHSHPHPRSTTDFESTDGREYATRRDGRRAKSAKRRGRRAREAQAGRHGRGVNEERTWKHRCFGRCNREPRGSSSSHRLARLPRVRPRLGRSGMGAGAALHCTAWFVSSSRHQRRRPRREWKTGRKRRGGRPARGGNC